MPEAAGPASASLTDAGPAAGREVTITRVIIAPWRFVFAA